MRQIQRRKQTKRCIVTERFKAPQKLWARGERVSWGALRPEVLGVGERRRESTDRVNCQPGFC